MIPSLPISGPLLISLTGGRSYTVAFESLDDVPLQLETVLSRKGKCVLVTDDAVGPLYAAELIQALCAADWHPLTITVPHGERSKSIEVLSSLYDQVLAHNIDRQTPVLALGGGVVGDLAGFAAATLLRGLPFVQIPSTLIAQVDSALGGKTGINHATGKNLIGAFHQPVAVITDTTLLDTLPEREWTSGLAEVVKHALIADASFFSFLEKEWLAVLRRDRAVVPNLVYQAARIKAEIVSQDEREQGLRATLNFGHTFGHALEKVAGYGRLTHGEAVAVGMKAALRLSATLYPSVDFSRAFGLVAAIPMQGSVSALEIPALLDAMSFDKKASAGRLRFVVLDRIGHAVLVEQIEPDLVIEAFEYALS